MFGQPLNSLAFSLPGLPCHNFSSKVILCHACIPAARQFCALPLFLPCRHFYSRVNFCFAFISAMNFFSSRIIFFTSPLFVTCHHFWWQGDFLLQPCHHFWGEVVLWFAFISALPFFSSKKKFKSKKILNLKKAVKGTSRQPIITAQGEVAMAWQQILQKVQKCSLFHEFWVVWDILGYFLKLDKKEKGSSRQLIVMAWREVAMTRQKKIAKSAEIQIISQVLSCLGCSWIFFEAE